ncbi:YifB family Mg chelatase-like AAA ATPase [Haliovirga abyssi]|uniref:Magnesium transporter n=1 Tax=Haliovirga abyssi TaxID=2996794 RepID=A0AAU9D4G1_9FUSO|nr:YifB family Mg chelatase-like AAA ATPase [Haliovirga abyssi]BDU50891.1 magnesium transporter [Haliovirga abyssi]
MLSKIISSSFIGVKGFIVGVEVDVARGLPSFTIVGLGDAAISESKERVRAAIKNSDISLTPKKIIVNLSPADMKKEGSYFDLPISIGILASLEQIKFDKLDRYLIVGELSLSGEIRRVKGIINSVITAKENGLEGVILPFGNYEEAKMIKGIKIVPVKNLNEAIDFLNDDIEINLDNIKIENHIENNVIEYDFKDVKGQEKAKRAVEISAAGGHNLLMIGSPGSGKSMIAKRVPGILPEMTDEDIIEATKIYSIAGLLTEKNPIIRKRPFRSPHHTASDVALIGGGRVPRPGEISLAHNGVLFLDELTEFPRKVLEVLRQPLEDRIVSISRAAFNVTLPANFITIAAANPCKCGFLYETSDSPKQCTCTPSEVKKYQQKLSGPIIDRMDLYVEIRRLSEEELLNYKEGESSEKIKLRVEKARDIQRRRFKSKKTNSNMTSRDIKKYCKLDEKSEELIKLASRRIGLSGRGFDKILKTARTIADLNESEQIQKEHILEAVSYRNQ